MISTMNTNHAARIPTIKVFIKWKCEVAKYWFAIFNFENPLQLFINWTIILALLLDESPTVKILRKGVCSGRSKLELTLNSIKSVLFINNFNSKYNGKSDRSIWLSLRSAIKTKNNSDPF